MLQHTVMLASETDWPGFRQEVRGLLARLVPPEAVSWHTPSVIASDLCTRPAARGHAAESARGSMNLVVPRSFVSLCETVVLHEDPARFALLYRLLWRLVHEPALGHAPLDAERLHAQHMAQAVRRDMHRMKAFVRFCTIEEDDDEGPLNAAWFEPVHHVVEAVSPFFARRFMHRRWALFTPERSVRGRGEEIEFGPGVQRDQAPASDAGEALWLMHYHSVFDPTRPGLATHARSP
ncbi:TIGR03915 family putative DNA repair protein [Variovorax sp. PBL-E5]|uniref:TIGR03915 family putative DNA repair protein n=1 Tax=Variovorax sp. PBL-E5 TaxID=434014 RepID=UPI001315CFC0|nr:TIGR03915 family putative DNA repair protein [Variovorax sp. PBL-E5]VTU15944.1 putative DNA metabolism protein [Variovorax sp. PBL-E5]